MPSLIRDIAQATLLVVALVAPAEAFAQMKVIPAPLAGSRPAQIKAETVICVDEEAISSLILAARLDRAGGGDGGGPIMVAMARQLGCNTVLPAGWIVFVEQRGEALGQAIECLRPREWAKCYWALAGNLVGNR